jgi:hypothetical protein
VYWQLYLQHSGDEQTKNKKKTKKKKKKKDTVL